MVLANPDPLYGAQDASDCEVGVFVTFAWKHPSAWTLVRSGMSERQVISLLGRPTRRTVSPGRVFRTLFYQGEVEGSGYVSGNVQLSRDEDRVTYGLIDRPVFSRDTVAESLTPEQLVEGQKSARECLAAQSPPAQPAHPLVGLSKTQIRERLGPPSQEGTYSWHYETPSGAVGIYFDENYRVEGLNPSDVDLNDLPSLVERDTPLPRSISGMPPYFLGDVDPRTLVGLTMDEVTVRIGQPLRNLGSTWRYATSGGLVTLMFEGTRANGQVVTEVQTPEHIFPRR